MIHFSCCVLEVFAALHLMIPLYSMWKPKIMPGSRPNIVFRLANKQRAKAKIPAMAVCYYRTTWQRILLKCNYALFTNIVILALSSSVPLPKMHVPIYTVTPLTWTYVLYYIITWGKYIHLHFKDNGVMWVFIISKWSIKMQSCKWWYNPFA